MVLRPRQMGVVRSFMVIPDGQPGGGRLERFQIRIRAILGVADDIILIGDDLVGGLHHPAQTFVIVHGVTTATIFVEIIAKVNDQIDIAALGRVTIGVEEARRIVRTGKGGDIELLDGACRQRLGAPGFTDRLAEAEAIVILPARLQAIRQQFEINALAPLRLVSALTSNLSSGSWIALMTSRMGSIADNSSGGSYGYRMSKAALNIAAKSLAIDLKPQGIAVVILHPGLVATRMINYNPSGISPQQSVEGLLKRIDALTLETSGSFWHANGDVLPW